MSPPFYRAFGNWIFYGTRSGTIYETGSDAENFDYLKIPVSFPLYIGFY